MAISRDIEGNIFNLVTAGGNVSLSEHRTSVCRGFVFERYEDHRVANIPLGQDVVDGDIPASVAPCLDDADEAMTCAPRHIVPHLVDVIAAAYVQASVVLVVSLFLCLQLERLE